LVVEVGIKCTRFFSIDMAYVGLPSHAEDSQNRSPAEKISEG